ncbi:hypothetical protein ACIBBB_27015 [Streptomyces sp. NPDC051217]
MLHELLPDEREIRGLLALLLANHARRGRGPRTGSTPRRPPLSARR